MSSVVHTLTFCGWLWLIPSLLILVWTGWRLYRFERREKAEREFEELVRGLR